MAPTPPSHQGIRPDSPLEEGGLGEISTDKDLAAKYLDQLQRGRAEFDNYRRRVLREREEWRRQAQTEVVARLLPVLDDLRRARGFAQDTGQSPKSEGLLMILKRLEDTLMQLGLEELKAGGGTEFDPEQHEAVLTASSGEIPEGRILRVLEPGYLLEGRLIRPSRVSVSSGPAPEP